MIFFTCSGIRLKYYPNMQGCPSGDSSLRAVDEGVDPDPHPEPGPQPHPDPDPDQGCPSVDSSLRAVDEGVDALLEEADADDYSLVRRDIPIVLYTI